MAYVQNKRIVIAKPCNGCGNPFSFKGNTDSFTLRVQNDISFSCCERHGVCSKLPHRNDKENKKRNVTRNNKNIYNAKKL